MTNDLPLGWAWARLDDLVAVLDRMRVPLNKEERNRRPGSVPYYGATGQVDWVDEALFDEELLLLGEDGAPFLDPSKRKSYIIRGPSWVNNHAHVLRALDDLTTNHYLKHYLDFVDYRPHVTGTTRLKLTQRAMRSIPIRIPPVLEQERIVVAIEEHFSRLDAVNASLDAAETRCQALIRSVIVGSIPAALPDDWQLRTVAEAGETGLGRQRSPKYHRGTNMKPYLRVANVFEDRIDTSSIMEMHFEEADFEKYRLRDGDILLNEGQSPELLGRPAIYRGDPPGVAFTNSLIRFVPGPGVTPEWALLVFRRHMHARRFMRESRITTNIAHLALGRFRTVGFPIPPLDTQHELVASTRAALSSIDQMIIQIQGARARANGIRRAVLAAAFSGELVPQDPDDEPASALLERIAESCTTKPRRRKVP